MTKNIYTIIKIIAIGAVIFMGVDTFYSIVGGKLEQPDFENVSVISKPGNAKRPVVRRLSDYDIINRRSIFGKTADEPKNTEEDLSEVENLEPTSLDLILLGTAPINHEESYAIIEDKQKRSQDIYHIGDSVKNAVIKNILRNKVILNVNGKDEILLKADTPTQTGDISPVSPANRPSVPQREGSVPARTITLQRSEVEKSFSNIQELLTQASIKPHYSDGEADGLAITGIRANSIFRKIGLRNGDIVKSVKGNEIKSAEDLASLYGDLQNDETMEIKIIRRGRERNINYRFR